MKKLLIWLDTILLAILPMVAMTSCLDFNEIRLEGINGSKGFTWKIDNIKKKKKNVASKDPTGNSIVHIWVYLIEQDYMNETHDKTQLQMWYVDDNHNLNTFFNNFIEK